MISVEGVSHAFAGVPVLEDVSFSVPTGGFLGLVGPGGCGKSLILKMICGLMRPDAGRLWVDGVDVCALGERALMAVRGRIGMMFQNYALFDAMTVAQNVGFPLARLGRPPAFIAAEVARRLAQVNLSEASDKLPGALSGGMKKRVCVARATIHEPPYLLCDDPTAGLDPVTSQRIFDLLGAIHAESGATVIVVSHEVAALRPLCDRLVMLEGGRVVFEGSPREALAVADPKLQAFVGQPAWDPEGALGGAPGGGGP